MVNPDTIPDGRYVNLYCPECQAHPDDYEIHSHRGWYVLRHPYCKHRLNPSLEDGEYAPTLREKGSDPFDDRLFRTDD